MDFGDFNWLVFIYAGFFIWLIASSVIGAAFGKKNKDGSSKQGQSASRPTELSQGGGAGRERQQQAQAQHAASHEQRWEDEALAHPERHQEEVRERYGNLSSSTRGDGDRAGESSSDSQNEQLREALKERYGDKISMRNIRSAHEQARERYATSAAPSPDAGDRNQGTSASRSPRQRHRNRDGGDVLRGWLTNPDTLGRAFIVKEVLDRPLSMRDDR